MSETTIIAVAVVEREGCFLVGERPQGVALAGYAEFPGGKVEPGEQPSDAAARECFEETGVAVTITEPIHQTVHAYEHGRLQIHFFLSSPISEQQVPRPPFRWVAGSDLAKLPFPDANAELLRMLNRR